MSTLAGDWAGGAAGVQERLEQWRAEEAEAEEAPSAPPECGAATSDVPGGAASAGRAGPGVQCDAEKGCVCLEPGLRCGFWWLKSSAYEAEREVQKKENDEFLRSGPWPVI